MTQWVKLGHDEIPIGDGLPWPIYDNEGTLLLAAGQVVRSEMVLEQLLDRGACRMPNRDELKTIQQKAAQGPFPKGTNPFQVFADFLPRLKSAFESAMEMRQDSESRFLSLARDIQRLYAYDPDAALAIIHLPYDCCYTLVHPLHCAIICELLASRLEYSPEQKDVLGAAVLSANLGMLPLQRALKKQTFPLLPTQQRQIEQHPAKSVELLMDAEIKTTRWLDIVLQHHEREDGSGYPSGLRGEEILQEAKLLAVADTYTAMVGKEISKNSFSIKNVLKELFVTRGEQLDEKISLLLIKQLGVFPPGSFVRLKNGDTAIVIRQTKESTLHPIVKSIHDANGRAYTEPFGRDTRDPKYTIESACAYQHVENLNLSLIWSYV